MKPPQPLNLNLFYFVISDIPGQLNPQHLIDNLLFFSAIIVYSQLWINYLIEIASN